MQLKNYFPFTRKIIDFKADNLKITLNPYEKNYYCSTSGGITA
jgi:hypothetical protein